MEFVLYKLNLIVKMGLTGFRLEIVNFYLEIVSPNSGLI